MEWRVIPSCAAYEVSERGDVRRVLAERGAVVGRVLRPSPNNKGYLMVDLFFNGNRRKRTTHTLVAEAFIGPRPEGFEVLHGDGDCRHNHWTNLRYGTQKENGEDTVRHGHSTRGERHGNAKLTEAEVQAIRVDPRMHAEIAVQYGISSGSVSRLKTGARWGHSLETPDNRKWKSRLSDADVADIRARRAAGEQYKSIASAHGISATYVLRIARGECPTARAT